MQPFPDAQPPPLAHFRTAWCIVLQSWGPLDLNELILSESKRFQKPPTQEDLKELLMSMKGSETFAELGRATIRKQELKSKKVAAAAAAQKAAAQKAASSPAKTPVKKGQKRPLGEPGSPQKRTKISYQVTAAVDDEGCKVSVNFKKCFL